MTTSDTGAELSFVDVLVNGSSQLDVVRNNLLDVCVEEDLFLPDACTLRIADISDQPTLSAEGYFTILDNDTFSIGSTLIVKLGYEDAPTKVFDGEITSIELEVSNDNFPVLVVRGYDRSHRLRRERKTAAHVQVSDSDIASSIASAHGLTAQTVPTSVIYTHVFQDNQTDWDFLRGRAARIGYDMFVSGQNLYFQPVGHDTTSVSVALGDTLHRIRVRMSAQSQVSQVSVRGWDPTQKAPIIGSGSQASSPPQVGEARTGATMASSMGTGLFVLSERVLEDQDDAQKVAQAMYDVVSGDFLQVEGVCSGDANLRPGRTINIQRIGRRLSGQYYVTAATHRRRRGEAYVCSFVVNGRRPSTLAANLTASGGPGALTANTGRPSVVTAVVTDSKDPETKGRVKVKFPWLDGTQASSTDGVATTWARVASPMAGSSRGLIWLPEVNDEVLVAFEHGDINRPFVVGGLWNGTDTPPQPAGGNPLVSEEGKVERRLFATRAGHTFLFDDSDTSPSITLTTKSGHTLKMDDTTASPNVLLKTNGGHSVKLDDTAESPNISIIDKTTSNLIKIDSLTNAVQVKATGNMSLEATGDMSIKGAAITIEATGSFTLKSSGLGTVQAGGPLAVKGAVVQIN